MIVYGGRGYGKQAALDVNHLRVVELYPEVLQVLLNRLKLPEPLLVHHCRINNVPANDMYYLIQAAINKNYENI